MPERAAVTQARDLADLRQKILQARAMLAQLHEAASLISKQTNERAKHLIAANERLVITALRAQSDADTATHALGVISRSAEVDSLTELPNRAALLDRFSYAIATAKHTGAQVALLFIDLNDFKIVNDTLGHAVGDQVLKLTAQRLASAVRASDTVSRHGGDEFLILITDVIHATDVAQIAVKLLAALDQPTRVGESLLRLGASIGISLFPTDGEDADVLIDRADSAMYRAKRDRTGGIAFHGELNAVGERELRLPGREIQRA